METPVYNRESEIEAHNNSVVKKNWSFYKLPTIILCLLLLDLCWEILRTYMCQQVWPWKLSLLGITPSATLSGVFASLIFAREQFARTVKPHLSWSTHFAKNDTLEGNVWVLYLMNAGPGTAIVESVRYSINLMDGSQTVIRKNITISEVVSFFNQFNLVENRDFVYKLITKGCPLPPVKKPEEGIVFIAFKSDSLKCIKQFDIHITVVDAVGDRHIKSVPFLATLPVTLGRQIIIQ